MGTILRKNGEQDSLGLANGARSLSVVEIGYETLLALEIIEVCPSRNWSFFLWETKIDMPSPLIEMSFTLTLSTSEIRNPA